MTPPKKLLIIAPYPPSHDTNSLLVESWLAAMTAARPDLQTVVAANRTTEAERSIPPGAVVHRVWTFGDRAGVIAANVLREADREEFEVAHVHFNYFTYGNPLRSLKAFLLIAAGLRARGIPVLLTLHSVIDSPLQYIVTRRSIELRLPGWMEFVPRRLSRAIARIVVLSVSKAIVTSSVALASLRTISTIPEGRLSCIPVGLAVPLGTSPPRPPRGLRQPCQVTLLGRIVPYKGVDDLIVASRLLASTDGHISLRVIGPCEMGDATPTPYFLRLWRLAQTPPSPIRLENRMVPLEQLHDLVEETDVFVFPFRDDGIFSASGSVLDFAARASVPIVLTDAPRLRDYAGMEGTIVARERDPSSLAEAIRQASRRRGIDGDRRQEELNPYTAASIAGRYLGEYKSLARPARAS